MRILIGGPIGSGKTTQARILSQELHIPLIKAGELIRLEAEKDTPEGRVLKEAVMAGEMAPDDLVAKIFKAKLKLNARPDFISDGFPRRLSQLEVFDPGIQKMIYLDLPEEEICSRLQKRGREDDKPEIIGERLRVYHEETLPLLEYYEKQGLLIRVDATGSIEQVKERIRAHLEELKGKIKVKI